MTERLYYLYLACLNTVYAVSALRRAVELAGGPEALFEEYDENTSAILGMRPTEEGIRRIRDCRNEAFLERTEKAVKERGIRFVTEAEAEYPERLNDLKDRPFALFYRGSLPDGKTVAGVVAAGALPVAAGCCAAAEGWRS